LQALGIRLARSLGGVVFASGAIAVRRMPRDMGASCGANATGTSACASRPKTRAISGTCWCTSPTL
jgi:hypothetical protein